MGLWEKIKKSTGEGVSNVGRETTELMSKIEGLVEKVKKDTADFMTKVEEEVEKRGIKERAAEVDSDLREGAERVKEGMATAAERAADTARAAKLRLEVMDLERKIRADFAEIGGKVYDLLEEGTKPGYVLRNKEVRSLIEEVRAYEKEIVGIEKKLKKLRAA